MTIFYDGFESIEDIYNQDFGETAKHCLENAKVYFAGYQLDHWEGWCLIVYERDSTLYEVNDSHCSCHGLEHWDEEETSWLALSKRTHDWGEEFNKLLEKMNRQ